MNIKKKEKKRTVDIEWTLNNRTVAPSRRPGRICLSQIFVGKESFCVVLLIRMFISFFFVHAKLQGRDYKKHCKLDM